MEKTINDIVKESEEAKEENCSSCGRTLAGCLEGWTDDGVCSGRCWADLFGEWDS